jgi:protocatechuate 3,4-dioxygenase alpha subunit
MKRSPQHIVTPSQTVGPYFGIGMGPVALLTRDDIPGDRISIQGRVLDGNGQPVTDGMLELWQANSRGKYAHPEDTTDRQTTPGFTGFGRVVTDGEGAFRIDTIRPGAVPWRGEGQQQAPHINVNVFARGLLKHLPTRIYFQDDPQTAEDPVLRLLPDAARRETLLARPHPRQAGVYLWDVVLRGPGETVFFDV